MASRTRRRALLALASTALAPALVPVLGAAPASASTLVDLEAVVEGLDNPRGLAFGPDGDLYIAESGSGGEGPCAQGPEGDEVCFGESGAVTRFDPDTGTSERVAEGLPSIAAEGGAQAIGPTDVAFTADGQLLVTIGLGADPAARATYGEGGEGLGTLVSVDPATGEVEEVADIADFEAAEDPDQGEPDSNPNSLLVVGDEVLVADAGGNSVVAVDAGGEVSLVSVLPGRTVPAPPGIPDLPPQLPMQPVPTSLAAGPDGQVLVGQLTGFPFPVGGANVYAVDPAATRPAAPVEFAGGFTNVIDVLQRDDDTFVLEIATNSLLSGEDAVGALARLRPDGTTQRVGQQTLRFPGGMALSADGDLFITNLGVAADQGQVLRLDPSLAGDERTQAACPPDDLAFPPFTDIAPSVHEEAVACMWWWDVTQGRAGGLFAPSEPLTRGQTASLLVRAAGRTTLELPTTAPDAFTDDNGSVHESAINILAAAGVMTGTGGGRVEPQRPVTRAQLTALVVRAAEEVLAEDMAAGDDAFGDDEASVHEADINKAAAAGWILGVGPRVFAPDRSVTRDQTASIMMRALADLVEAGEATLPDPVSAE